MPFRDIIGHRKLVALLARAIASDRLPPSLIFSGPSGVGKRRAADAIAQTVNCLSPRRGVGEAALAIDACGECTACRRIAKGTHPDVIVLAPGDNGSIKVDVVRDVNERAGYRPFEGRRRVVIIDEADALVAFAQNALLKTLEEPPSASMFILVTARPDTLLPTVRSRCPRLRFRPLSVDEVAEALVLAGRPQVEARATAATSDGSIGLALQASGEDMVEARDTALRVLGQLAGGDDPRRRIEVAKALVPKTAGSAASDREQLSICLRVMASLLRDVELLATAADRRALAHADLEPALTRLSYFQGARGVQAFAAIDRALVALDRNVGVKLLADWVALNI